MVWLHIFYTYSSHRSLSGYRTRCCSLYTTAHTILLLSRPHPAHLEFLASLFCISFCIYYCFFCLYVLCSLSHSPILLGPRCLQGMASPISRVHTLLTYHTLFEHHIRMLYKHFHDALSFRSSPSALSDKITFLRALHSAPTLTCSHHRGHCLGLPVIVYTAPRSLRNHADQRAAIFCQFENYYEYCTKRAPALFREHHFCHIPVNTISCSLTSAVYIHKEQFDHITPMYIM